MEIGKHISHLIPHFSSQLIHAINHIWITQSVRVQDITLILIGNHINGLISKNLKIYATIGC